MADKELSNFLRLMAEACDSGYIKPIANYILEQSNINLKIHEETAKAFIIYLVLDIFGAGAQSDIVLYSLRLLRGYENILGITDRRKKFLLECDYQWIREPDPNRELDARAKDFIKREKSLYEELYAYYIISAPGADRMKMYLKGAMKNYLEAPAAKQGMRYALLPEPAYLRNRPIATHNLQLEDEQFMGREDILAELKNHFKGKKHIQTLYGMGGVGKTMIALRYAHKHKRHYSNIAWINANSRAEIHTSCLEFLRAATSDINVTSEDAIRSMFLAYFESRTNWLIVYDNADYLDDKADDMSEVLASYMPKSGGHILITTRCDRDFMGAARIAVDVFTPELARQFLVEKSGLEADQDTDVLAQKLGYLPLALQYTASYIQQHCSTYREYLDLWDEDGMNLFDEEDGGYAEKTVRKAFHITLDKIKDDPIAMDLLHRLACLNTTELPVERYLEVVSQKPDAPFYDSKWFGTISSGYEKINEQLVKYRVPCWVDNERIRISPDTSSYKIDPSKFIIIRGCKQDCLHPVLERKATRNALFRKLGSYSLITWDKINISMHPLLREIIYDEMYEQERGRWCSKIETSQMLSVVFRLSGSEDAARKHLADALRGKLNQIRGNTDSTKEYIQHVQRMEAEGADVSHLVYGFVPTSYCAAAPRFFSLFKDILELNDADLIREALSDYRYLMETLYGSDDILHYKIGMKACKYDKQFYSNLASAIGHDILYKSFRTPKRRQKTGEQYFIGIARHNAPHDMEYPAGEAVRVAVDVWLDDICDADELKTRLQTLVADRSGDWWVIALPEYGADVVDSLSLLP